VIRACGISDTGRVRKSNEDKFVSDPEFRFFAVADGMGGHSAGEVASGLAIETLQGFIHRSANDTDFSWPYGLDKTLSFDGNRLRTAIHLANRRVFRAAESSDDYGGMGTTIVGLLVGDSRISVAHVGDSRLYLLSGDHLVGRSHDRIRQPRLETPRILVRQRRRLLDPHRRENEGGKRPKSADRKVLGGADGLHTVQRLRRNFLGA